MPWLRKTDGNLVNSDYLAEIVRYDNLVVGLTETHVSHELFEGDSEAIAESTIEQMFIDLNTPAGLE